MSVKDVAELVRQLYGVVDELECAFPGRHFTPDGHLVGSIGEAVAAHAFGLELADASNDGFDAIASDGRRVEVKATQRQGVALQAHPAVPDHLLALKIERDTGRVSERRLQRSGGPGLGSCREAAEERQRRIALSALRSLMGDVSESARLPQVDELP